MRRILLITFFILISGEIFAQNLQTPVYGPTTTQEHIWQLAKTLRPNDSVTLQQVIIALQEVNPNAFEQNNINGLKPGQMLHVPSLDKIKTISSAAADKLVAKQNQTWKKNPTLSPTSDPKPLGLPVPTLGKTNITADNKDLQEQLIATQEDLKTYKRQATESFNSLQQQNLVIQSQLLRLNQTLAALTQQVLSVRTQFAVQAKNIETKTNYLASLITLLPKNRAAWWITGMTIILLALIWYPWSTDKESRPRMPAMVDAPDLGDEYDFMNSQEAIPAKLNLARAYIDMDDFQAAVKVLQEVVKKGNESERQQARQLLNAIKLG